MVRSGELRVCEELIYVVSFVCVCGLGDARGWVLRLWQLLRWLTCAGRCIGSFDVTSVVCSGVVLEVMADREENIYVLMITSSKKQIAIEICCVRNRDICDGVQAGHCSVSEGFCINKRLVLSGVIMVI